MVNDCLEENRCTKCAGLCVLERVAVVEQMLPSVDPLAYKQRWWKRTDHPIVLVPYGVYQTRCLNCGGVRFLS